MTATITVARAMAQAGLVPVDAQVLLAHVTGNPRAWLVAHADAVLGREQADAFFALAGRRRAGEPVAYLTGMREFWGLPLRVSPAVLIPRPETEALVEQALLRLPREGDVRVLDLGTGSGALALAIARERPQARVVATDVSTAALAVARDNGERLGLATIAWLQSDWYAALPAPGERERDGAKFDVIVSNPPYVAVADRHLHEGDLRFEPAQALASGIDGLTAIRCVIAGASVRLVPGGSLLIEHGYDQAARVQALFRGAGLDEVGTVRDLAGIPRVSFGRLP